MPKHLQYSHPHAREDGIRNSFDNSFCNQAPQRGQRENTRGISSGIDEIIFGEVAEAEIFDICVRRNLSCGGILLVRIRHIALNVAPGRTDQP